MRLVRPEEIVAWRDDLGNLISTCCYMDKDKSYYPLTRDDLKVTDVIKCMRCLVVPIECGDDDCTFCRLWR